MSELETEARGITREVMKCLLSVQLCVPDELCEKLEALKAESYPQKTYEELIQLLLWRGIERTERILKRKNNQRGAGS